VAATHPPDIKAAITREQDWQFQRLPENLREWVVSAVKKKQRTFLPPSIRP
jgi:hypothetical protein